MSKNQFADAYALAAYIKNAEKKTPVRCYIQGQLENVTSNTVKVFGDHSFKILMGDYADIKSILEHHQNDISDVHIECDRRNSAVPLMDIKAIDARIEPGAYIREQAIIGSKAVIMMGAIINIGASVGEQTMIDMNAVVGARAIIGKNCHIGAGAIIAGVLEPPSKTPVIIEDEVLVGANAVVLEGVRIGQGAIVAAGAIVTTDVKANTVVAGSPARFIKNKDEKTIEKTQRLDDLRK